MKVIALSVDCITLSDTYYIIGYLYYIIERIIANTLTVDYYIVGCNSCVT